jgi:lysophospholipase L1-like esterase
MRHKNAFCGASVMPKINRLLTITLTMLAAILLGRASTASALNGVTFTITVKSAFLRGEPSWDAARVHSVFQNQAYGVSGRNADNTWLQLEVAGGAWAPSVYGTLRGDIASVPILAGPQAAGAPAVTAPALSTQPSATRSSFPSLKLLITTRSAYARNAPSWGAARVRSVFRGQTYAAVGRTTDAEWIQIQIDNLLGWVSTGVGKLSGSVSRLPVTDAVLPGQTNAVWGIAADGTQPAWIPVITPYMHTVYEQSQSAGHSLNAFAVIGDCNSERPVYLGRVSDHRIDLRGNSALEATVAYFTDSFPRASLAVYGSFNTSGVLNPDWRHPTYCHSDEGPFQCELRVSNASIVFIMLGTGDQYTWRSSEANYRTMIEYALRTGVLPVLVTKADTLETRIGGAEPDYLNGVMRRLAQEYQVPLLDFWLATRGLPNNALQTDGFHLSEDGINMHVLATLQTLQVIWRP